MTRVFINRIATAVPAWDVHEKFVAYAPSLLDDEKTRRLFAKMVDRSGIEHRYSVLAPHASPERLDSEGFYRRGAFPGTADRMARYKRDAFTLAADAVGQLELGGVSHVIVTSCTGFYAPGLDLQIVRHFGLGDAIERSFVGFMGCQAALNALKLAWHIVRSQPRARVLMVNLELCTLHLHETPDLEQILSFLIFADGGAATLVSAAPEGLEIAGFGSTVLPDSADQITWDIGASGFDMVLSGRVPLTIGQGLADGIDAVLGGYRRDEIGLWAVHPGGRSVLDAVERAFDFSGDELAASREVLRRHGNMSSPTVMFVLAELLREAPAAPGCAIAFGPGLTAEAMLFEKS